MAFINFGMANTLAQAKASTNKNKLFFPTDTHSIVIDGKEYGDSYAVVDIGTQSNFTGTYPNGYYDLSISGNDDLYTLLLNIWNSKRIPVLRMALNSHTVGVTLPLIKTNNNEFQGCGKVSNDWVFYARIYDSNGIKRIYTVGVYTKPTTGIPKTDLASPVQAALASIVNMRLSSNGIRDISNASDSVTASEKAVRAAIDALDTPFGVLAEAITYLYNENKALRQMITGSDNATLPTVKTQTLEYEQAMSFGAATILVSTTEGAPSAAVIPDNWDEETMNVWNGCPRFVGQRYIDQVGKKVYEAVTLTGSTSDWVPLN